MSRRHGRFACPEARGDYCAVCERRIAAAEDARSGQRDDTAADREADRYEREVLGL